MLVQSAAIMMAFQLDIECLASWVGKYIGKYFCPIASSRLSTGSVVGAF
jgi:hypothetical protein